METIKAVYIGSDLDTVLIKGNIYDVYIYSEDSDTYGQIIICYVKYTSNNIDYTLKIRYSSITKLSNNWELK